MLVGPKPKNKWIFNLWIKRAAFIVLDVACVYMAYLFTLLFRFGGEVPPEFLSAFYSMVIFILPVHIACNAVFSLYNSLWEHAGLNELVTIVFSCALSALITYGIAVVTQNMLPRSVYIAAGLILILLFGFSRMGYRVIRRFVNGHYFPALRQKQNVLIVGAGDTGAALVKQLVDGSSKGVMPIGFVDDDPEKRGAHLYGLKVLGSTDEIPLLVRKYDVHEIIFAIASSTSETRRRILDICTQTGCRMKIIPGLEAMLGGVDIKRMRDVNVDDLLARKPIELDMENIRTYLTGAKVLVTGGGGSIGGELCRQIARFQPDKLIIFDIYENNAYELYMDLKREFGDALDLEVLIGSVRDRERVNEIFLQYKPDVVFHAAAHKHVPLMEQSPAEAVKNNVNGTVNVAKAADEAGVKRFVLISTDKAVNPANIMGATKYLCELVMQYMNQTAAHTRYVTVRFGNVLGSNGSVIPLFKRQIEAGGPVTVTHRDITRYFMTIPEAAQLVLQAGSMAEQGEVFILDMGQPVKIDDFARTFIRLSGYEPDVDIKIKYTGLRPGEKMYEELWQSMETQGESTFPGILIGRTYPLGAAQIGRNINYIQKKVEQDSKNVYRYMEEVVPTYHHGASGAE